MKEKRIKLLTRLALLIAISAVAAYIPIPSPTGTVALDSAPGYFAVLTFGGVNGGIVLGIGHLFSSFKTGFPLGAIHILIAFLMTVCGMVYYWIYRKFNLIFASLVGILLNGIGITAFMIPIFGFGFFVSMALPLLTASIINIVVAAILYKILDNKIEGIGDENRA